MFSHSLLLRSLSLATMLVVACQTVVFAGERKLYVGKDSSEAKLAYTAEFQFQSKTKPTVVTQTRRAEDHVVHLFGPMAEAEFRAVPKTNHTLKIVPGSLKLVEEGNPATYSVSYQYSGTIVAQFGGEDTKGNYKFVLPMNIDTVYDSGFVGSKNRCTDSHYQSQGDFWYFWNPYQYGCPMKEGVDFQVITGKLIRAENTTQSFPEYDRLVDANGNIVIDMFLGMDEANEDRNPLDSADVNAENYRGVRDWLTEKMGFTEDAKFAAAALKQVPKTEAAPFIEAFTKSGPKANLVVRMFFGHTGIDEDHRNAFHHLYKNALENSSVMIYDGHSGLGGHLDLESIESLQGFQIQMPKSRYQILYFNSCSSYPYYNSMYFARKQTTTDEVGSKNLDIITNGLATLFDVMSSTNSVVISAIDRWAQGKGSTSYQTIVKALDSGNLVGINGDEDNPKTPVP